MACFGLSAKGYWFILGEGVASIFHMDFLRVLLMGFWVVMQGN
jgi:hypothetical protein